MAIVLIQIKSFYLHRMKVWVNSIYKSWQTLVFKQLYLISKRVVIACIEMKFKSSIWISWVIRMVIKPLRQWAWKVETLFWSTKGTVVRVVAQVLGWSVVIFLLKMVLVLNIRLPLVKLWVRQTMSINALKMPKNRKPKCCMVWRLIS